MNRRSFVSTLLASAATTNLLAQSQTSTIKRVLVMFKCHLDVGFVDTQAAIIRKYFDEYYPRAIALAATMRNLGSDRYVWTTGSWLLYSYLEQASSEQVGQMEQAVARGDIAWHALPFTWQSELLDRSAITGCLGFSKALDKRFNRKTTGGKMTDVPGHTRGLVGPLAASGITFLDIGVNAASTPPDVPPLFVWKDVDGALLTVMYHRTAYGGVVRVPASDLAIAVEVRDDNSGPHTLEEVHKIYSDLRARYPAAEIRAANLTEIADAIQPYQSRLPVFTQEIGDTWIYGVASDPIKLARYRELLRLRAEWVKSGTIIPGDKQDLAFLQMFALAVEHTWGTDTKTWLDFDHPHRARVEAARSEIPNRYRQLDRETERHRRRSGCSFLAPPPASGNPSDGAHPGKTFPDGTDSARPRPDPRHQAHSPRIRPHHRRNHSPGKQAYWRKSRVERKFVGPFHLPNTLKGGLRSFPLLLHHRSNRLGS